MEVPELLDRRAEVVVLDVRWANEWEPGHIEGAVHVPSDYLYDHLDDLDCTRPIVAVCRTGVRSATAVDILRSEDFTADSLAGGLAAWVDAGLPLVAEGGAPGTLVDPEPPADDRPEHLRLLESAFLDTIFAVEEFFGDREASEEEVRDFLRNRLIGEGHSPAEADRILDGKPPVPEAAGP